MCVPLIYKFALNKTNISICTTRKKKRERGKVLYSNQSVLTYQVNYTVPYKPYFPHLPCSTPYMPAHLCILSNVNLLLANNILL